MNGPTTKTQVAVIGGGMITRDQLLPSLYHLQRLGELEAITVCAQSAGTIRELAGGKGD